MRWVVFLILAAVVGSLAYDRFGPEAAYVVRSLVRSLGCL